MFGAIDIGGTKTLLATFDNSGKILKKYRFETPRDYNNFLKELEKLWLKLDLPKLKVMTVAIPGVINKSVVKHLSNLPWVNISIRDDIEKFFQCPILLNNDAKLAGLFESINLKGKYRKVLYITVSTGIGAGLIINNKIDKDFENMEVGQMLFENEGKLERWESFASGKAIYKKFGKPAKDITNKEDWYIISHNLAIGIIDLIASLTPDIIVIGGGVGSHFEKFGDRLIEDLRVYQNNMLTIPPVIKAKDAEDAVIFGCYEYGKYNYEQAND